MPASLRSQATFRHWPLRLPIAKNFVCANATARVKRIQALPARQRIGISEGPGGHTKTVSSISSTIARVIDSSGASFDYTDKNGSSVYLPRSGTQSSLTEVTGGGWIETRPDGTKLRYGTDGAFSRKETPAGGRWTIVRSGDLLSRVREWPTATVILMISSRNSMRSISPNSLSSANQCF